MFQTKIKRNSKKIETTYEETSQASLLLSNNFAVRSITRTPKEKCII